MKGETHDFFLSGLQPIQQLLRTSKGQARLLQDWIYLILQSLRLNSIHRTQLFILNCLWGKKSSSSNLTFPSYDCFFLKVSQNGKIGHSLLCFLILLLSFLYHGHMRDIPHQGRFPWILPAAVASFLLVAAASLPHGACAPPPAYTESPRYLNTGIPELEQIIYLNRGLSQGDPRAQWKLP